MSEGAGKRRFKRPTGPVEDVEIVRETEPAAGEEGAPAEEELREARRTAVAQASLMLETRGERPLYATKAFFHRAADQLWMSTRYGLELAGACYARRDVLRRTVLVGIKRRGAGLPGRVAVSPEWGSILWHTHPGLRGSLAAFSAEDVEAARAADRPLLVIGFGGLSPDVISTLTLPLGVRGFLVSSGVKGLLSLEKSGKLRRRLLRLGVAARVCYPSGRIQPILRAQATPLAYAVDDVSFAIDRSVGAVERAGQKAIRALLAKASGGR